MAGTQLVMQVLFSGTKDCLNKGAIARTKTGAQFFNIKDGHVERRGDRRPVGRRGKR